MIRNARLHCRVDEELLAVGPHDHLLEGPVGDDDLRAVRSDVRSEEHTSELQSRGHLVCRLLLEKKKIDQTTTLITYDQTLTASSVTKHLHADHLSVRSS